VLAIATPFASRNVPVIASYEAVAHCKAIKLHKFTELNLTSYCDVEITEGLGVRGKGLCVVVVFIHIFVLELVLVVGVKVKFFLLFVLLAQIIFFEVHFFN
jgi:hypothetical protein